ncbi:MAG: hypothetical protein R2712_11560 [Vicinamibacterales bacterium]
MMTMSGIGAVCGAMVVAWLGRSEHMGRLLLILLVGFGVAMTAFALSTDVRLSTSSFHRRAARHVLRSRPPWCSSSHPGELRGRVVSIYMVAFRGGSPLGGLARLAHHAGGLRACDAGRERRRAGDPRRALPRAGSRDQGRAAEAQP